ncbi:MAG: polysaccharide deacetylase family protein [Candidatus Krumholzibacteriota bacterium]|nr:polysaccharide deacetylase family protein [Candidatus Krumholzibacteriota bacterium]
MGTKVKEKIVPLLVTVDIETAPDHDLSGQKDLLISLGSDLASLGIRATLFPTAKAAERSAEELRIMSRQGHEIGCHGFDHGPSEDYSKMPVDESTSLIGRSARIIEETVGCRPVSFRAPRMAASSALHEALEKNRFSVDFSISPRRVDFFNSRGAGARSFFAPPCPYHPCRNSPYREGERKLLVIPLSGFGIPFLSGSLFLFGLSAMKVLFRKLLSEAERKRCVIVYLFHSYEFAEYTGGVEDDAPFSDHHAVAKRKSLHRLYRKDRKKRYEDSFELFRYMTSFDTIRPLTGSEYLETVLGGRTGSR